MDTDLTACAQRLRDTATALAGVDLTRDSDAGFVQAWLAVEDATRVLTTAVANRMVVEVASRGLPQVRGFRGVRRYLMQVLRLSGSQAWNRVHDAEDFGIPVPNTGGRVVSRFPHVTAAQRDGAVTTEHCHAVREVMRKIPAVVDDVEREKAEVVLTDIARTASPDEVTAAGHRLLGYLDPDGALTGDGDRARRRGVRLSKQGLDLMSGLTGALDPQARALLEVVLAKWAAPGANNFGDPGSPRGSLDRPDFDPAALEAAAGRDHRSQEQRNHDALKAVLLWVVDSGVLREHNGLPMHVIVTMTLRELETQTGVATTATGGRIPVDDALKLAARQRLYLCLFDLNGRPLFFAHDKQRSGNLDQRLALVAAERGCTGPRCRVPAALCQTHHRTKDYAHGSHTGIDDLTLACRPDHAMLGPNNGVDTPLGWHTRAGAADGPNPGRTEWIPPSWVDPRRRGLVNDVHHPDRLLAEAERRVWAQREAAAAYRQRLIRDQDDAEAEQRLRDRQDARGHEESCLCYYCDKARAP